MAIGQNNLGGVGPDTGDEALEFLDVGTFGDDQINLVVTILENDESNYLNHVKNGNQAEWNAEPQNKVVFDRSKYGSTYKSNYFGQINIKADHQADMQFCFVVHGSKAPVTLDAFSLTFWDFGACLPACLPACPPARLLVCLPACLSACLPACRT